jgi:hypothetical protein
LYDINLPKNEDLHLLAKVVYDGKEYVADEDGYLYRLGISLSNFWKAGIKSGIILDSKIHYTELVGEN